ncbi:ImmA/IrrE family metallo-endopeptidase [Thermosediminibacter litoriperuensis]|uniref:Uncharacterized protein DUF955 n=1 Tax=Thermosediminibacter litoriperuensis TaxID=291989 RepID=A0A5S5AVU2_9FIRM|nr:ImmA/IrrE family metallo-endopeptidase [Thermosediminibacter litoriperuensis]TYP57459.1 uncharacterized protein DUF955 [Thermosediminibacter litoriperuensis]
MHDLIKECVFRNDKEQFNNIEDKAIGFADRYIGSGVIIQDDIFNIIKNYEQDVNLLLFPIPDDEICGFICNYKGKLFIYVNTNLPLEKQIFTAAHELYHLLFNRDQLENGYSHMIKQDDLDGKQEERTANLFAALLLVPRTLLKEQIEILKIDPAKLNLLDIIRLMDVFAVPYKTMILRLYETGFLRDKDADKWLQVPDRDENEGVLYEIRKHEIGLRWQERTRIIKYGNLKALIMDNNDEELIPKAKAEKDLSYIQKSMEEVFEEIGEKIE